MSQLTLSGTLTFIPKPKQLFRPAACLENRQGPTQKSLISLSPKREAELSHCTQDTRTLKELLLYWKIQESTRLKAQLNYLIILHFWCSGPEHIWCPNCRIKQFRGKAASIPEAWKEVQGHTGMWKCWMQLIRPHLGTIKTKELSISPRARKIVRAGAAASKNCCFSWQVICLLPVTVLTTESGEFTFSSTVTATKAPWSKIHTTQIQDQYFA